MKTYKSKLGLEFRISAIPRPAENSIVNWSQAEFDWIKANNLNPDEYQVIHNLKLENYAYSPVPQVELSEAAALAKKYVEEIKKTVFFPNGMEKKNQVQQRENVDQRLLVCEQAGGGDPDDSEAARRCGRDQECTNPGTDTANQS